MALANYANLRIRATRLHLDAVRHAHSLGLGLDSNEVKESEAKLSAELRRIDCMETLETIKTPETGLSILDHDGGIPSQDGRVLFDIRNLRGAF